MEQLLTDSESSVNWEQIRPALDEALDSLADEDREVLLLRYFKNQDFRAVGHALGVSDDTAQKRVSRAVERLREFFAKRGVNVGAGGLVVVISANAVQSAPVGLAVTISTVVLAGTITTATIATQTTLTTMNWINAKAITAVLTAAVAAGTGTYLVQQRDASRLRSENRNLIAQQEQTTSERDAGLSAMTASKDELERLRKDQNELLRLRGEIGMLRKQSLELENLRDQNRKLQSSLATANQASPKEKTERETDTQRLGAYAKMSDAKLLVLGLILYASDNQNQLPTLFNQTTNYWTQNDQALTGTNQFELVVQGSLSSITHPSETIAVREKEAWFAKGKWFKTYGFADGHSEVHTEPGGNFEVWEKQRMLPQPNQ